MARSLIGRAAGAVAERRARNLATRPPDYAGRPGSIAWSGTAGDADREHQMAQYGSVGTLFSVVSRLATATAKVEWCLYRKASTGVDEERVQVTAHPALNLWSRPNNFYTRNRFVETVQQHCDLTGEQWWVLVRDPALPGLGPLEMWPVRPDRMTPVPSREAYIAGYVYTSPSGEKVPLAITDVVTVMMPNPLDPYRGLGPVQALGVELDSARYTAEWNRNFFLNSAQPGGVVEFPETLSDPEFETQVQRWKEQHKGVNNAHRVAILEAGAKWVGNQFTQKDMQFAELRSVIRDAIREGYGIPKFALGDSDDVNRAVGEAMNAFFAEHLTEPRLDRIKEALNFQLLPMFYPGGWRTVDVEFDYISPVPPDLDKENANRAAAVDAAVKLVTQLGRDPSAVLQAFGLPDLPAVAAEVAPEIEPPAGPTAAEEVAARAAVAAQLVPTIGVALALDEARGAMAQAGWPIDPFRDDFLTPEPVSAPAPGAPDDPADGPEESGDGTDDADAPDDSVGGSAVEARRRPSTGPRGHGYIGNTMLDSRADLVPVGGRRRVLNEREDDAEIDPDRVQDAWLAALAGLLATWERLTAEARDRLADQIRAAVNSGDVLALAALAVPSSEAAAALLESLTGMWSTAADEVVREARAQGVSIEPAPVDEASLTAVAVVTASLILGGMANAAGRESLRWLGYGRDGDTVSRETSKYLAGLSDAFPRANLGHALTRAQNMARAATFDKARSEGLRVKWYASEVLDGNTCKPCSKIDGKELPTTEAMILAYGGGPYLYCLGTIRCRGLVIGVWQ